MKKLTPAAAKKIAAACASTALAATLGVAVTAGSGSHAAKPAPQAGSTWAGIEQGSLLNSILGAL